MLAVEKYMIDLYFYQKQQNLRTIYSINEMKLLFFSNWNNNPNSIASDGIAQ